MPLDWEHGELAEGLRCYRSQDFFLAHEHWEAVWLASADPEKTFLQCLIQIAAAMHHFERSNHAGAVSLLSRSLQRLAPYPSPFGGVELDSLRQSVRVWIEALERDSAPDLPYPRIR